MKHLHNILMIRYALLIVLTYGILYFNNVYRLYTYVYHVYCTSIG